MKILILGGTYEARMLAERLVGMGHDVLSSLAGRTSEPLLPKGAVRIGGFGGISGLVRLLTDGGYERLVDATHPYAVEIARNAVKAAETASVKLVRLVRPAWVEPKYAFWAHARSAEDAAAALPGNARALLTVGHGLLDPFFERGDCQFVVRTIEPPDGSLPGNFRLMQMRPPFFVGGETQLLRDHGITHLVTKNSGGAQTEAKLTAALALKLGVVMIDRPELPPAHEVPTVGQAIAALRLG